MSERSIPLDYRIETERLELRISQADETDFVWDATRYDGFNDSMMWNKPESKAELEEFVHQVPERWRDGIGFLFTLHEKASGKPRGRIVVDRRRGGWNTGFWTHPKYQGAGYATEALEGILVFAFEELEASEVNACHAEWNIGSRKVLERNGFRFRMHIEEGFERGGEWVGLDLLSLSRSQWLAARGAT